MKVGTCIDHGCVGDKDGYARAWLVNLEGKRICSFKHRRVYYEATGELPKVVRHTCDNPRCINPKHLLGGTQQDNMDDMVRRGRSAPQHSTLNPATKYPDSLIHQIRTEYVAYSKHANGRVLAKKYGISFQHISAIVTGKLRGRAL